MSRPRNLLLLLATTAAAAGCHRAPPPLPPPRPPEVVVAPAVVRAVTDTEEFTGRTEAFEAVEVRARVSGHLEKVFFKDGDYVKKGDVLFQIDPQPLQAELDRAEANLHQAEARVKRLQNDAQRARRLVGSATISREEYDKIAGDLEEAVAAIESARAARNLAKFNLDYSRVKAPIDGRISRRLLDPGNMVKADETALTYLADLDRIYVYFDVDERTYLRISRFLQGKGVTTLDQLKQIPVQMGLADEDDFPRSGMLNFVDNRIDQNTGSVWVRGVFPNADRLLVPGLFVRVRLPVGEPHRAVLVPERALATDQGQKFVWVVNDKNEARYRRVQVGDQHGSERVVLKGIEAGERVIVSGLQRVRNAPGKDYAEVEAREESK